MVDRAGSVRKAESEAEAPQCRSRNPIAPGPPHQQAHDIQGGDEAEQVRPAAKGIANHFGWRARSVNAPVCERILLWTLRDPLPGGRGNASRPVPCNILRIRHKWAKDMCPRRSWKRKTHWRAGNGHLLFVKENSSGHSSFFMA